MKPNNVTRLLDAHKISYTPYDFPPEKLGALEVARLLGVPPQLVYKTIVVTRDKPGKPILALVPAETEVDLKALAQAMAEKKLHLPTERQAEQLTGLQAGGISALALLKRGFQVLIDASAQAHTEIYISGGQRGLNIRLPVKALIELINAKTADITRHGMES